MTRTAQPAQSGPALDDMWNVIREHHGDIAGVKRQLAGIDETLVRQSNKMEQVIELVSKHTSRQAPTLVELMGGMALLLSIVGGLAVGIGTFVSATYDARLAASDARLVASEKDVGELKGVISTWRAEALVELARLREEQKAAQNERLKALEAQAGWTPTTTPP